MIYTPHKNGKNNISTIYTTKSCITKTMFLLTPLAFIFFLSMNSNIILSTSFHTKINPFVVKTLELNRKEIQKIYMIDEEKLSYPENKEILNVKSPKIISVSPGGFLGFYLLGICSYIKDNYNLSNYKFAGASAGSWNALFMTFKKDPLQLTTEIIDEIEKKGQNINDMENIIKETILKNYKEDDFDLSKLEIAVSVVNKLFIPKLKVFSNFTDLEDALDCCMSSSHIPLITGDLIRKYKNNCVVDGGLTYMSYVIKNNPVLHITPSIWNSNLKYSLLDTIEQSKYFVKNKSNFFELYSKGYEDAKKNTYYLDNILGPKIQK
jgi:hypothetical protein